MTHAPASPSAALSASEQRASGIRAPSLSPAPARAEPWCRWLPGTGRAHTPVARPRPFRARINQLGCKYAQPGPAPARPPQGLPPGKPCRLPPPSLRTVLIGKNKQTNKKNKARLQPSQPLFSPPEGAPGVGERRARNALPLAAAGCPRGQNCVPQLLSGTLPTSEYSKRLLGDR